MLKGTEKSITTFSDNGYYSKTDIGNTQWQYDNIEVVAETKDYFVFIFSPSHAQVYDKEHLNGGNIEEFRKGEMSYAYVSQDYAYANTCKSFSRNSLDV